MIAVPLLARRLAIGQRGDDVVQKFVPLLDLARLGDHPQPVPVQRRAFVPSESATNALRVEIADDDRVPDPHLDQQREERAARSARTTGSKSVVPVRPPSDRRAPCVPGVLPVAPTVGVLTQRAAPDPKGDRSEIIEAAEDLPEAEGEAQDGRIGIADEWEAAGAHEKVPRCHDLVALALYHHAGYALLQRWQDEDTERLQAGRVSPKDLAQLESVAVLLHQYEGIFGEEGDLGEIRAGRASAQLECC